MQSGLVAARAVITGMRERHRENEVRFCRDDNLIVGSMFGMGENLLMNYLLVISEGSQC